MEFFRKSVAVKLRSNRDKYLVAEEDQETVRQSRSAATTRRARWMIEFVDSNPHVIRLKSCYGRYLTASTSPFLLGMTGNKVIQTVQPENTKELAIEWQPIRDGFQVKIKAFDGSFLRANSSTPPWSNSVTHDSSFSNSIHSWTLWEVEGVDIPEDEAFHDYISMISNLSSVSDELSGMDFGSPMSVHSSFSPIMTPNRLSINKRRSTPQTAMDLFKNAKAVRLRSHHDKYLYAEDDEESVSQDRHATAKNSRWTVEFVDTNPEGNTIRLKSCYDKYLTASNQPFLLGMTGRKVTQTVPRRLDSSVEWEPIKENNQVKLKTRYGQFLRANGGLPPWRNSVTHDIPHRTATQDWILWDVDVVEIVAQSPVPRPPPKLVVHSDSFTDSESSTPSNNSTKSHSFSRQESSDHWQASSLPRREDGRTIYYHVIADGFEDMDENAQGFAINFKGNEVEELTRRLEEETGLGNITVCSRSPLDGKLYPLRLQLPPNNVTMKVIIVQPSQEW